MTTPPPYLFVEEMKVFRNSHCLFSAKFHEGINIISGDNSTGKSTIVDLMTYALGYDLKHWNEKQLECTHVLLEVRTRNLTFTIKRQIIQGQRPEILFFYGKMQDSLTDTINWQLYPPNHSTKRISHSEHLFDLVSLPLYRDSDATLTMHQILRLIYVDQQTPETSLLSFPPESYERESLRKAIGSYLLGIANLEPLEISGKINELDRQLRTDQKALDQIELFLSDTEDNASEIHLENSLRDAIAERTKLQEQIDSEKELDFPPTRSENKITKLKEELSFVTIKELECNQQLLTLTAELHDTKKFLTSLESHLDDVLYASETHTIIGNYDFHFCPRCLQSINTQNDGHTCYLCKSSTDGTHLYRYEEITTSIRFQLSESTKVVNALQTEIDSQTKELKNCTQKRQQIESDLALCMKYAEHPNPGIFKLYITLGKLDERIELLNKRKHMYDRLSEMRTAILTAKCERDALKDKLKIIERDQQKRKDYIYAMIQKLTLELLRKDQGYETSFSNPVKVTFDFAGNWIALDDTMKFSASSEVILKNSLRSAIFLASTIDPHVLYPRLFINDNMEDKGMTPDRSHLFQRNLIESCHKAKYPYQVIFTTSMIAPEFNTPRYLVGQHYTKGSHTLSFPSP